MKIHTASLLVFYTATAVINTNALPVRRNIFSRRVFTSIGVSGAHRVFAKKEKDKDDEKKENTETSKHEIVSKKYWENQVEVVA